MSRVRPDQQVCLDREVRLVLLVQQGYLDSVDSLVTLALRDRPVPLVGQDRVVLLAQVVRLEAEETRGSEETLGHKVFQVSLDP